MDLIDRQAAIDVIHGYFDGMLETDTWSPCDVYGLIEILPSADAVEVVRCKDCKWYKKNYSWNGKEFKICAREPTEPSRRPDDFCSYGERKTDEAN